MKNLVLRYGLYATAITVGIPFILFFTMGGAENTDYSLGEVIGYSTIILSMVFVFFGIKKHRDENNGGAISFWEALKVGVLIAAIPSLAFGLYNILYVEVLDPEFMDKYYQYSIEKAKISMEAADFEIRKAEMQSEKEMFQNPIIGAVVMFLTVFIIGFIVSLISSIVLKKEKIVEESYAE